MARSTRRCTEHSHQLGWSYHLMVNEIWVVKFHFSHLSVGFTVTWWLGGPNMKKNRSIKNTFLHFLSIPWVEICATIIKIRWKNWILTNTRFLRSILWILKANLLQILKNYSKRLIPCGRGQKTGILTKNTFLQKEYFVPSIDSKLKVQKTHALIKHMFRVSFGELMLFLRALFAQIEKCIFRINVNYVHLW